MAKGTFMLRRLSQPLVIFLASLILLGSVLSAPSSADETGTVQLTFTDTKTGAPIGDMCALVGEVRKCGSPHGVLVVRNVPTGDQLAGVYSEHGTHANQDFEIFVEAGKTAQQSFALDPAAAIATKVVDSKTGKPISGVCLSQFTLPMRGIYAEGGGYCSGNDGNVIIGPISADTYVLMAVPSDNVHGTQWVGAYGGTGDIRQAKTVKATTGQLAWMSAVRMDLAGDIVGKITDGATGAIAGGVCVFPYAKIPSYLPDGSSCTDSQGAYKISGLGPYKWPLEFMHRTRRYALQWSGGVADRLAATPIQVTAGTAATADATMVPAGSLSGRVLDGAGQPASGYVEAFNARSGDEVLSTSTRPDSTRQYTISGLSTQDIKIQSSLSDGGMCWYKSAQDFDSATAVHTVVGQEIDNFDLPRC